MKTLIYKNKKGATKLFQVKAIDDKTAFGNKTEEAREVGFRARVLNRGNEVRSFRYDGIVAVA